MDVEEAVCVWLCIAAWIGANTDNYETGPIQFYGIDSPMARSQSCTLLLRKHDIFCNITCWNKAKRTYLQLTPWWGISSTWFTAQCDRWHSCVCISTRLQTARVREGTCHVWWFHNKNTDYTAAHNQCVSNSAVGTAYCEQTLISSVTKMCI